MRSSIVRVVDPNQEFQASQPQTPKARLLAQRKGQFATQITPYLIIK